MNPNTTQPDLDVQIAWICRIPTISGPTESWAVQGIKARVLKVCEAQAVHLPAMSVSEKGPSFGRNKKSNM